ncbi:MAG: outer membrane beta-barrel protein [Flavobacteriales bacterium]|nr:outer membrane beta-barrel protein [Flavobacteriales bacterium]HRH69940.1 outer membrane beta-barrel protein [Flavobacteriales bacterium]
MRPRYVALLPGLVFGVFSHAQSAGIGFKGGLLVSTVKALNVRTGPIPGATVGLYVPCGIGPRMELQPELLLSSLGSTYFEADGDAAMVRSLYLQMPISLKMYLGNGFNLAGGFQFGKLLVAQQIGTEGSGTITSSYNALDMGFIGGIGMDLESGVDLSLRAYGAMTPALRNDDALFPKNRSLELTVGYRFSQFKGRGHFSRHR